MAQTPYVPTPEVAVIINQFLTAASIDPGYGIKIARAANLKLEQRRLAELRATGYGERVDWSEFGVQQNFALGRSHPNRSRDIFYGSEVDK